MHIKDKQVLIESIDKRIARLKFILESEDNNDDVQNDVDAVQSDNANKMSDDEVEGTLMNIARQELTQLKVNKDWLEREDGGMCVECEEFIPIQRLIAVPTTRRCINCAQNENK